MTNKIAVYGTQGGGAAICNSRNEYFFIEKPDCPGLDIGDNMPEEWGTTGPIRYISETEAVDLLLDTI